MNKLLLYHHPQYTHVCWAICQSEPNEAEVDAIARVAKTIDAVTGVVDTPYRTVDPVEVESNPDNDFRNAWEDGGTAIQVNMSKARIIHMDKIRRVRNAELAKLDVPWMKAVEAGDALAQSTVATEKQILRDIPQTFDLTTEHDSPEELKQKWPEGLPKE